MSASVTDEQTRPVVRTRRTAVTFDSTGGIRVGGIPQFSSAVTDFADLTRDPEPVTVGGRIWSPANMVAAVAHNLRATELTDDTGDSVVVTYPASYSDKQVALLRQALDLSGARDMGLVPEPVAAAEWLEREHGPLEPGFVLVYDLGGTSLDVTVVRVGPDWENHPMIGKSLRDHNFGGKPLGAMIARYAGASQSGPESTVSGLSMVDTDGLRVAHVRDSLEVVRACVRSAGITMLDVSRILLVGGASRPAEVAATVAELGRPVVLSTDPGQTVAAGAALMAAKVAGIGSGDSKPSAPRVAVFSSAAVVSAVAMSAATVFGGPGDPGLSPLRNGDFGAAGALLDSSGMAMPEWTAVPSGLATGASTDTRTGFWASSAYSKFITPVARSTQYAQYPALSGLPGGTVSPAPSGGNGVRTYEHHAPNDTHAVPNRARGGDYSDPAYFVNPMPFVKHLPAPLPEKPKTPPGSDDGKPTDPPTGTDPGQPKPGDGSTKPGGEHDSGSPVVEIGGHEESVGSAPGVPSVETSPDLPNVADGSGWNGTENSAGTPGSQNGAGSFGGQLPGGSGKNTEGPSWNSAENDSGTASPADSPTHHGNSSPVEHGNSGGATPGSQSNGSQPSGSGWNGAESSSSAPSSSGNGNSGAASNSNQSSSGGSGPGANSSKAGSSHSSSGKNSSSNSSASNSSSKSGGSNSSSHSSSSNSGGKAGGSSSSGGSHSSSGGSSSSGGGSSH